MRSIRELLGNVFHRTRSRDEKGNVHDVRRSGKSLVVLRERALRIELSRRSVGNFFSRNRRGVAFTGVIVIAIAIFWRAFSGFASTATFYPSSCLGSWDNVQNALGKPDLPGGADMSAFTPINSAFLSEKTEQMFCGNFGGDADIQDLSATKSFTGADIVLSWTFVFPEAPAAAPAPMDGSSSSTASSTASSTDMTAGDNGSTTAPVPVAPTDLTPTTDTTPVPDQTPSTDTTPVPTPTPTPTPSPAPEQMPAPEPVPMPAPTPEPPAPTSWLRNFFSVAYADDVTTTVATDAGVTASAGGSAGDAATTTATTTTTTDGSSTAVVAVPPAVLTVNTSMFQNIIIPSSSPDDIINLSYSTDGTTWLPVTNISEANWQQGRYSLPIHSWEELKHLQLAFVGLETTKPLPRIYLDGMSVEVKYEDLASLTSVTNIAPASSTDQTQTQDQQIAPPSDDATVPFTPPPAIVQRVDTNEADVFDQGAHQQCAVLPFSATVPRGSSVSFSLELSSGLGSGTTSVAVSPLYGIRIGSLPAGVSAQVQNRTKSYATSSQAILMNIAPDATRGSYSLLVVYRERQDDASLRSTACQFNLVVQ